MVDASIVNDYAGDGTAIYESATNLDGIFGGMHAGYNFQTRSNLVFGVEADLNIGDHSESGVVVTENGGPYDRSTDYYDLNAFGSGRLRLGFTSGNFMPYLTAGLAIADLEVGYDPGTISVRADGSDIAFGFTVGGGAEYALSDSVRIRAEYRYTDFGTTNVTVDTDDITQPTTVQEVELSSHTVSLGLSFAF